MRPFPPPPFPPPPPSRPKPPDRQDTRLDTRETYPTKLKIAWECYLCQAEIAATERCYRVLDEKKGFPIICIQCAGMAPGADTPMCRTCLEPITLRSRSAAMSTDTWIHEDGKENRELKSACDRCDGTGIDERPGVGQLICRDCTGIGVRTRVDHYAWPIGVPERLEGE